MQGKSLKDKVVPYLFILPFLISFLLFFVIPSIYSFYLSFTKYPGYGQAKWLGIQNYRNILHYGRFWDALGRTFFYWLVKFIPVTVISFMMAYCLKTKAIVNNPVSKVIKPILFLPQVYATTACALVFMIIFATQTGVINQIFGGEISWIENARTSKWVVLILLIWRGAGWFMVVYLSGMTAVSQDVIEASKIDGANAAQTLRLIIIPLMKQTFKFAFIMDAISSLRMYTEAAVLTAKDAGGVAREVAEGVINLLMFNLNSGNFGMACAYGWIIFVIIFVISLFILGTFREKKEKGR